MVLRLCPKCGFDFRSKGGTGVPWATPAEEASLAEATEFVAEAALVGEAAPVAEAAPFGETSPKEESTPAAESAVVQDPTQTPVAATPSAAPASRVVAAPAATSSAPTPRIAAWPSPTDVPMGAPAPGKHGGKVCQTCRREYPNLWRLIIRTPFGFEEQFVCGTGLTCQMPSLVPAVQV